jgi:hypothetical protein
VSAASLILNRWFAPDTPELDPENPIRVTLESESRTLKITSGRPVRFVGFLVRGDIVHHVVPESPPTTTENPARPSKRIDAEEFVVCVRTTAETWSTRPSVATLTDRARAVPAHWSELRRLAGEATSRAKC